MSNKIKVCDDVYIDRIYVINLEKEIEMKKHITKQLTKYNLLEHTTFIKAIYNPNNPAYGCTLSHHLALKDMLEHNYDVIMILEDDCEFIEFPFNITDEIPKNWMMIYPGYLAYDELSFKFNNSFIRLIDARSTHCYIIKKEIVRYVLAITCIKEIPLDMRYINPVQRAVECYGIYPIKAYQIPHKSTIYVSNKIEQWKPIMDMKATKCFNNKNINLVIATEWKQHIDEFIRNGYKF